MVSRKLTLVTLLGLVVQLFGCDDETPLVSPSKNTQPLPDAFDTQQSLPPNNETIQEFPILPRFDTHLSLEGTPIPGEPFQLLTRA